MQLTSALLSIALFFSLFSSPPAAFAGQYQQCEVSSTCTIGEFLYDDEYQPLTGATCTISAQYPNSTSFLSSQALTEGNDAWYYIDATIGTTEGLYPATICCTAGSDYLCLDKSFSVFSSQSSLTAADVWTYSDRTLSSYGTLVADIWAYTSRSLTGFGDLVEDIWDNSTRSLSTFGTLVADIWNYQTTSGSTTTTTTQTLTTITTEQTIQRELLEKLVNTPVISLDLEDGLNLPDLNSKIKDSQTHANNLYDTVNGAQSRLLVLNSKWNQLSATARNQESKSLATIFADSPALISLSKAWNSPLLATINSSAQSYQAALAGSTISPSSITAALKQLTAMETAIGDITSPSGSNTLFGYLSQVQDRNALLDSEGQKIAALLENFNGQGETALKQGVAESNKRLLAINEYPKGESVLKPSVVSKDNKINLKNALFSLQALLGLNRNLMAANVGDPIRSLWLEEGSIVFRAVITNPSTIISQDVPLKFYLPKELTTNDIVALDPSLTSHYDTAEEALYVTGTFTLSPLDTKVVYVEVQDVWQLSQGEVESLKKQSAELLKPLEKTSFFSQGTILKSDIDVTLDKVLMAQAKAVTPENRIRAYREAQLELNSVNLSLTRLQDLVAQANNTGSIFGFVGGVQAVAVWGILIIVVVAFVFMTLYMRQLSQKKSPVSKVKSVKLTMPENKPASFWQRPAAIPLVILATAAATVLISQIAFKTRSTPTVLETVPESLPSPVPSPSPLLREDVNVTTEKQVLGAKSAFLTVPEDGSVNVRSLPNTSADIVMNLKTSVTVYVWEEEGSWQRISLDSQSSDQQWWVHSQFID